MRKKSLIILMVLLTMFAVISASITLHTQSTYETFRNSKNEQPAADPDADKDIAKAQQQNATTYLKTKISKPTTHK